MLKQRVGQAARKRRSITSSFSVDWRVRNTYRGLLSLPVPEWFIELVQSYAEPQENRLAERGPWQPCLATT
jgi:hypothetical protein